MEFWIVVQCFCDFEVIVCFYDECQFIDCFGEVYYVCVECGFEVCFEGFDFVCYIEGMFGVLLMGDGIGVVDFCLKLDYVVDQCFGCGWIVWYVDVDWYDLVVVVDY